MTTASLRDSWLRRARSVTGWVAAGSLAAVGIFAGLAAQPTHTTTAKPAPSPTTPTTTPTSTADSTASTPTTLQAPTTTPTTSPSTTAHATSGGS